MRGIRRDDMEYGVAAVARDRTASLTGGGHAVLRRPYQRSLQKAAARCDEPAASDPRQQGEGRESLISPAFSSGRGDRCLSRGID